MKTLSASVRTNSFRNFIAGISLAAVLAIGGTASAQSVQFTDNQPLHIQQTDGLKVAVFPVYQSMLMKVHVENPNKEMITVLIKDDKGEIVYKKQVGRTTIYNGKFDVSQVADGNYTMVIESKSQSYANSFFVETHQERIARAL